MIRDKAEVRTPRLRWPSGEGTEYGIVHESLGLLAELTAKPIHEEEGAFAVVLDDDTGMPFTLICEPAIAGTTVALIADAAADVDELQGRVEAKLGKIVHWHAPLAPELARSALSPRSGCPNARGRR